MVKELLKPVDSIFDLFNILQLKDYKGNEFLPQTQIFEFLYLSTWCCKPLKFQTNAHCSYIIHILKYQRSTTLGCKDIGIIKSEFVAKIENKETLIFLGTFKYLKIKYLLKSQENIGNYRFLQHYQNT